MDCDCRHMMILTDSSLVEDIMIMHIRKFETEIRKKDPSYVVYMQYVPGRDDLAQELVSRLPIFVKKGYTIILKGFDQVYGCMYDLLNLNYSKVQKGAPKRCNLFHENKKVRLSVDPNFKCIILMGRQDTFAQRNDLEKKQPPPFLNRFEKYFISEDTLIPSGKQELYRKLTDKYFKKDSQTKSKSLPLKYMIHNLSRELITSLVLRDTHDIA